MVELENIYSTNGQAIVIANEHPQISTLGIYDKTVFEAPIYIGKSQIETEYIGAFTFINLRSVNHETTNCVIECQRIGRFCMIAHSVNIGLVGHPTDFISNHLIFRYDKKSKFAHDYMMINNDSWEESMRKSYKHFSNKPLPIVGNDVWIGYCATVLNGVNIGDGAIIAAGSVVTKDVEPYSIVAGNPARKVRMRFDEREIENLMRIKWWRFGPDILHGINLWQTKEGIKILEDRVESGQYLLYHSPKIVFDNKMNKFEIKE